MKLSFKKDILIKDHQKAFKLSTLFFISKAVIFNGQDCEKQVTNHSTGYKTSSEKFLD